LQKTYLHFSPYRTLEMHGIRLNAYLSHKGSADITL
jgi:hypothetical protein